VQVHFRGRHFFEGRRDEPTRVVVSFLDGVLGRP
jgi:hypothetical protein